MWLFHCSLIASETCYLNAFNSLGLPIPLGLWRQSWNHALLAQVWSLSPPCICLIPGLNSLLCNSRDFLVADIIVCSSDSVCRSLSNNSCFGVAYVKKKILTFLSPCCLWITVIVQDPSHHCSHLVGYCMCVGPSGRGRTFGRGEAKAPLVPTNLLQAHEREERSTAWLQGYWGIAVKGKSIRDLNGLASC